jgi:hypothetical protein
MMNTKVTLILKLEQLLKDNSILGSLPENTYVYDITTGNFIYRQGKRVLKLDLDIQEG